MRTLSKLAAVMFLSLGPVGAGAESTNCIQINAVPRTITSPGDYCVVNTLTFAPNTGAAIIVQADRVVIDLNGWALRHGSPTNTATAISGTFSRITVRNGTIDGFSTGISLVNPDPANWPGLYLVEGVRINRSTIGMTVQGANSVIRDNHVLTTRGSAGAYAIQISGPGGYVGNNSVIDTGPAGTMPAVAIDVAFAEATVVEGNFIANPAAPSFPAKGINVQGSSEVLVAGNRIVNMQTGIEGGTLAHGNKIIGTSVPLNGVGSGVDNSSF